MFLSFCGVACFYSLAATAACCCMPAAACLLLLCMESCCPTMYAVWQMVVRTDEDKYEFFRDSMKQPVQQSTFQKIFQ